MVTRRNGPNIPVSNSDDDGPLDKNFEKLVTETLELWHVPGVSIAVVDGENTYAKVSS